MTEEFEKPRGEKLQKVLAALGLGSRRELERWIADGRVSVNGKVAKLGDRVEASDTLRVDGRIVGEKREEKPRTRVLRYHKPVGEVCTRDDPEGRDTVFEHLPRLRVGRWIQIGRLDLNTSGLLLFTNDGELANRLMHPSYTIEREYAVRILGEVEPEILNRLRKGVELDDGPAHFDQLADAGGEGANHWYHVVLKEGRNREVRRMWESQGLTVSRLQRVRFGGVDLPRRLRPGRWEELEQRELSSLMQSVDLRPPRPKKTTRDDANKARRKQAPKTYRRKKSR